jgi:integrase
MVTIRPYKKRGKQGFEVDIQVTLPDGTRLRERVKSPVSSKSGSERWGRQREAVLIAQGGRKNDEYGQSEVEPVPTLSEFWPRFVEGHAKANQQKPSTIDTRERIYRNHLQALFADVRLDAIDDEQVQRLKGRLSALKPKTVNCVLTVLAKLLKVAVEWDVIREVPCRIRLLKSAVPVVGFYEEPEYERLVVAAAACDARTHLAVLLGGDAGLRLGEIVALEWRDIDFARDQLKVQRAVYEEGVEGPVVTLPKGGKPRVVPMTARLKAALSAHRHLRGDRVLYRDDAQPASKWWLKGLIDAAERRAGLRRGGRVHILRHTFCSRLASRNVPLLSIKALAGHESLETTQRYMHLSSTAPREAIRALEQIRGDILETGAAGEGNTSDAA